MRMELLPPFVYLKRLTDRVKREAGSEDSQNQKSGANAADLDCSDCALSGGPEETQSEQLDPRDPSLFFLQSIAFPPSTTLQRILNIN